MDLIIGGQIMSNIVNLDFIEEVKELLSKAKEHVKTTINVAMVYTYYEIGRRIVEQEQKGLNRAEYGKEVIKQLSIALTKEFGKGYSIFNLFLMRKFYLVYRSEQILETAFQKSHEDLKIGDKKDNIIVNNDEIWQTLIAKSLSVPTTADSKRFYLSWGHYTKLIRISNKNERHFYEIESYQNKWSVRELQRQIDSCLYERLALSRDKQGILELSQKGQIIEKPVDAIKDPYVLNFLELKEDTTYSEKVLEKRIINKLQDFLMELGKGFTFVQRQMRLTFQDKHYYADLVFYNRFLKCFVVVDLKIRSLTHEDIGQMQMYVNYFDRYVKLPDENKTIGILLCKEKDDAVVELTLPEDNDTIFASKYETVLPSKEDLIRLINEK